MITSEATPRAVPPIEPDRQARRGLDAGEWALLIVFSLVSVWVLGLDLYHQATSHGLVWTGGDGPYPTDQLQYMAWVRSASQHLLVANLFVIHATPADYFQPAILISGLLVAAGMAPWLSLLLWKPVAVLGLFFAIRAYVRRAMPDAGRGPWLAVIALTLFYGSFTTVYGGFGVIGDLFPPFWNWGYTFGPVALAAIIGALIIYASARREARVSWWPGLLGALASILHPWQGELLVVILGLLEIFCAENRDVLRDRRLPGRMRAELLSPRIRLAVLSIGLTLIPLLYYAALGKLDSSWANGGNGLKHSLQAFSIFLIVLPLGLVALTGYRGAPRNFVIRTARVWPVATIIIFVESGVSTGGAPLHTFLGITLPLAVLAVDGCLRLGWGRLRAGKALAVLLILAFTVPTTYWELKGAASSVSPRLQTGNFITTGENRAIDFLARDRTPGGVVSRLYLGKVIPGVTGRHTYVGDCVWSEPNCGARIALVAKLLSASMTGAQTRTTVLATHARFLLTDCSLHVVVDGKDELVQRLGPVLQSVHRFGCATVYQVR
ncbi:MAG TPA: hypothetical protein VG321_10845 [Solirubrobacteraceae bacterium]|nr:hypothetical protein [Solirubrobacteraceae bacterium]